MEGGVDIFIHLSLQADCTATKHIPRRHSSAMRFHLTPRPLLHLLTTILLTPQLSRANPRPAASVQNGFTYNELFARYDCGGELCGWDNQLCCQAGSACYTNAANQAACAASASGYVSAAPAASSAGGGYWVYITTTTVITNLQTVTTVLSSYVPAAPSVSAVASASARCNYALNESPCGSICCANNQYCVTPGQCGAANAGQTTTTGSGGYSTVPAGSSQAPGAPIRPTSSGVVVVTTSQTPTTTVPFSPPVATGANVTMTEDHTGGGGLSGGAIAGIVIGVLVGLLILGLICFYCCLKGLLDGCLALFGFGKKRRRTEVDEYERRTHHSSHGGGRTWYGARKPSRVDRREKRESHTGRDLLGVGAGLAGLWAILGMKRRNNKKKHDERRSEYSYSSDYYTSASE